MPQETTIETGVTIAQAAQRLGVSERTIYRMLRSGLLKRVSMSDNNVRSVRVVLSNSDVSISTDVSIPADKPVGVSDKLSVERVAELKREIEVRDAQIAGLIESQKELLQSVSRLQEQMFELARLVLSQHPAGLPTVTPEKPRENENRQDIRSWWERWRDNGRRSS